MPATLLTPHHLYEAGFRSCPQPPSCWAKSLHVYARRLRRGMAYVLCPDHPTARVEAFVGDWRQPEVYYSSPAAAAGYLLGLLTQE
ncbi:hypothetical protein LJY25_08530 [Hymenobacter sp. BT175]|uniref:hypothetical protein n=1 Tax=Hymenobacter translucens TaxID=2886507 RepID=UPI001D0EF1BD|nr:hypothetical protein [Hymenobacter translucens]MCC2546486.1 hypothetical protein [Hymenobacter translucens]